MTPPLHHLQAVRELLGLTPRKASELAQEASIEPEEAYHCLAYMESRGEARIARAPRHGRICGWTQGVNA